MNRLTSSLKIFLLLNINITTVIFLSEIPYSQDLSQFFLFIRRGCDNE